MDNLYEDVILLHGTMQEQNMILDGFVEDDDPIAVLSLVATHGLIVDLLMTFSCL